jgi:HSP20 family protein
MMDQLVRESMLRPRPPGMVSGIGVPVDMAETDAAYVVLAVIPGARPEDVQIQISGDTLQLSGEVKEPDIDGTWIMRERRYGPFRRVLALPGPVRADDAEAEFVDGVLVVRLPKATVSRSRQIPIRSIR